LISLNSPVSFEILWHPAGSSLVSANRAPNASSIPADPWPPAEFFSNCVA
jgi:hypothetical protein